MFAFMPRVDWRIKLSFHVFGVVTGILGAVSFWTIAAAASCLHTTTQLYYLLAAFSTLSIVSIGLGCHFPTRIDLQAGLAAIAAPLWIYDQFVISHLTSSSLLLIASSFRHRKLLDVKARTGICYEPYVVFPCVWHV